MSSPSNLAEQALLKIGDVAQHTGITLRTLRYYEELGLIEPDNRSKGNYRLYRPAVIQRVQFINSLKKLDFSLDEIRAVLGPADSIKTDSESIAGTRQALLIKQRKIEAKLAEIQDMANEVTLSLKILDDCLICKQGFDNPCDPQCENKHIHIA